MSLSTELEQMAMASHYEVEDPSPVATGASGDGAAVERVASLEAEVCRAIR